MSLKALIDNKYERDFEVVLLVSLIQIASRNCFLFKGLIRVAFMEINYLLDISRQKLIGELDNRESSEKKPPL